MKFCNNEIPVDPKDASKGMKVCGSMMIPKGGEFCCPVCGATQAKDGKSSMITTQAQERDITVLEGDVEAAVQSKTTVQCPKCAYMEASYTIRQTRSADEPETMIYRCLKCNHTWREY